MDNNGEEFWEEYKQKLLETNDKWNYIDALIYRYRSPENLPLAMWSRKLDDNPNYWEEYIKEISENLVDADRKMPEYSDLKETTNAIELNNEEELEKVKFWWERKFIRGLFHLDKEKWKYLADSKPKLVTDTKIIASISKYNLKRVHQDLGMNLEEFQSNILPILQELMKDFKSSSAKPYEIELRIDLAKSGFDFDELVANPQIFYPFKATKEEATWEHQKNGFVLTLTSLNSRIERWQQKYKISQDRKETLEIKDEGEWFTTPYAIVEKLLQKKFEEISDLPKEILLEDKYKSPYCIWGKSRRFLENKKCSNKPEDYDVFCKLHINENDDISQNLRKLSIEREVKKYPDASYTLINFRYSYPNSEILDWRNKVNVLMTDYFLYLYPKLIDREHLRIERWKIQSNFFDALKPLYEKYHYLKFGRPTISMSQKLRIMKKTDFKCAICKADLTEKEPHIDHIIPLSKGGGNAESNLQALCWQCNLKKGTKIL